MCLGSSYVSRASAVSTYCAELSNIFFCLGTRRQLAVGWSGEVERTKEKHLLKFPLFFHSMKRHL